MSMLNENQDTKQPDSIRLVLDRLEALCTQRSLEPLKKMFWTDFGYTRVNQPLSFRNWNNANIVKDYLYSDDPLLLLATNKQGDFDIIYIRLASSELPLSHERLIIHNLLKDHFDALFIFSNASLDKWHFVNVKPDDKEAKRRIFRRFTVTQEEQLRTASERLALLNIVEMQNASSLEIQERHDEAFDVAAVTKAFFDAYQKLFRSLQKDLFTQVGDMAWAHDYAHLFLNRCMFLYFIQRKGWLGGDKKFLRSFWNSYNLSLHEEDTFFANWLQVLFEMAFNQKFDTRDKKYSYFPPRVKEILADAPFLGGLFAPDSSEKKYSFAISDARFGEIFDFFEGYNFTIAEDSPLDQEVAVDPEMIGRVYESLVNVSSELDERGDAGIFYTPRTEIDLMCRLSLVDYLANQLPHIPKALFYRLVFALEPHEKSEIDKEVQIQDYWGLINTPLSVVTVLDPACGSGAFLVGMLKVLDDLQARANRYLEQTEDDYDRRKRIIGQSLYGVDVMEWAARVAELRLWLILAVEPDIPLDQLHNRRDPILPYFTFKIRQGDSLIQQISENSGVVFAHKQATRGISPMLRRRLDRLREEKGKFYYSEETCQFKTRQDVEKEELGVFVSILQEREQILKKEIQSLKKKIALPKQSTFLGDAIDEEGRPEVLKWERELAEKEDVLRELEKARHDLQNSERIPFVWDIGFVEIFSDDARAGFDIVVGNPPYVRQENISNPLLPRNKVNSANKRAYKQKLAQIIYQAFPDFFQYKRATEKATHELDAKSDLYVYFYLHGLRLLNAHGSFCFITSNSWLDVGYGAVLQEFLLQHCKMKMIIDNAAKRSFATADVNTIIALFSPPSTRDPEGQEALTRFVRFTVDFEQVLSADVFIDIENAVVPTFTERYRVHPISQRALLRDGSTIQKVKPSRAIAKKQINTTQYVFTQVVSYTGNKLGGKYLRAPEIYWVLMEKGEGKLKRLGEIAEVRYGIKTGANDFFYLDDEKAMQWQIEEEFLLPIIKSPTECTSILVQPKMLRSRLFLCSKTEAELKGTAALEYIRWGESQGFHTNASVSGRTRWWSLSFEAANSIFVKEAHNTSAVFYNPDKYPVDCRLYYADLPMLTLAYLNSVVGALLFEIYNRAGLGGGARSMMVSDYALVPSLYSTVGEEKEAERVFQQVYGLPARKLVLSEERKLTNLGTNLFDRPWRDLDDFIFDILHLTQTERDAVYEEVVGLVEWRLKKAVSLNNGRKLDGREHVKRKDITDGTAGLWNSQRILTK